MRMMVLAGNRVIEICQKFVEQERAATPVPSMIRDYLQLETALQPCLPKVIADHLTEQQEQLAADIAACVPSSLDEAMLMLSPFVQQCLDRDGSEQQCLSSAEQAVVAAFRWFVARQTGQEGFFRCDLHPARPTKEDRLTATLHG
jgi:hypothetical protein